MKQDTTTTITRVTSADGTTICVEHVGSGPSIVLVDGALCARGFGPARALATELASDYTVYFYDRRGRGESGDTSPYAPQREVEDLAAVIAAAGGHPFVYGISSGGALALEAAASGVPMRKLAVYEAPYTGIGTTRGGQIDHEAHLRALLAADKRGAMVSYFLVRMVGAPAFVPVMMHVIPGVWKQVRGIAHTLPYDAAVMNGFTVPVGRLSAITAPTRVMSGGKAKPAMTDAQGRVAQAIPGAERTVLPGQPHQASTEAIAAEIREFFV